MPRLFAFPLRLKAPNGYWDQLYGEIRRQAPEITMHHAAWGALAASFGTHNIVHVHWPSQLYGSRIHAVAWMRFLVRAGILLIARLRGDRIVWTLHNTGDHEGRFAALDAQAHRFLARMSHAVIVHTPAGERFLNQAWQRDRGVHVIPHGHYIGFHGPRCSSPDRALMQSLGIAAGDSVFLAIGTMRPYKGLETLIETFNKLPRNIKLLIAGSGAWDPFTRSLRDRARQGNVIIAPGFIPGQDVPKYFSLGICSVFAFTDILTSGSVILSLSYGVPAVVPVKGDMPYVVEAGNNGFLYADDTELHALITRIAEMSRSEIDVLKEQAVASVSKFSYERIAQSTLSAYAL